MAAFGILLALLGFWIMSFARKTESFSGAVFFLMGLGLFLLGLYTALFEDGSGAARWMPGLTR